MGLAKKHIVNQIRNELGFPKNQSVEITESLLEIIKSTLESGDDLLLSGFGKFCTRDKKRRKGRHPSTGEDVILPARRVVTFKCSGKLREKVNGAIKSRSDRRLYPRHAALCTAIYTVNSVTYRDLVRDISARGIYIGTWRAIDNGQRISLQFPVFARIEKPSIMGTVVRSQDKGFAVIFDYPIEERICQTGPFSGVDNEIDSSR